MKRTTISILAHLEHCEDLLECVFNLTPCETAVYRMLLVEDGLTAKEVADRLGRSPNSAYRFLRSLQASKLVYKKQRNRKEGGYYYVYSAADPEEVRKRLYRFREEWNKKIEELILEFPREIPENSKRNPTQWPPPAE
jgi:predicted transcriptional regulator